MDKTYHLKGSRMKDIEGSHLYLKKTMDFPSWYGPNLDGLYDVLVTKSEMTAIELEQPGQMLAHFPGYRMRLLQVFQDAAKDSPRIFFRLSARDLPLLVIDAQHDFIAGSLACQEAKAAVRKTIEWINRARPAHVLYSMDWHSPSNHSFAAQGGKWPVHCVAKEEGAMLHPAFSTDIRRSELRPGGGNVYFKGTQDSVEEYSAYEAKNQSGKSVREMVGEEVVVCGIASEFCVRETVLELSKNHSAVIVLEDALGYVEQAAHKKTLQELSMLENVLIVPTTSFFK